MLTEPQDSYLNSATNNTVSFDTHRDEVLPLTPRGSLLAQPMAQRTLVDILLACEKFLGLTALAKTFEDLRSLLPTPTPSDLSLHGEGPSAGILTISAARQKGQVLWGSGSYPARTDASPRDSGDVSFPWRRFLGRSLPWFDSASSWPT